MQPASVLMHGCRQAVLVFALASAAFSGGQTGTAVPEAPSSSAAAPQTPGAVIKSNARLVSLEVVARDRQGHPVTGLTAKDFEVSEQILPKKDRRPQSIAVFRAQNWAELNAANPRPSPLPPGVYSNLVTRKAQVPPTILLFDGINTDVESQMQVHRQMVKILGAIPPDVPVAIFLMANQLRLVQAFTTDPKLLREAAAKTMVVGQGAPDQDPADNPDLLSAKLEDLPANQLPPGAMAALQNFEQNTFWFAVQVRMQKTLDALRSIARYLDGYPGRKNVLWISTSFPLMLYPGQQTVTGSASDLRDFQGDMQDVGSALMDAKIAIYPVDAGGVRTQAAFEASARVRNPASGANMGANIQREDSLRQGAQQVMSDIADETGGRVCLNDNDFGDCVKKAVDDASSYYELAYYPDTGDWRGEYHRIVVKTAQPGVHLSYREGYYARPFGSAQNGSAVDTSRESSSKESSSKESASTEGKKEDHQNTAAAPDSDPRLRLAACEDPLNSTAILLMAKPIASDQPGAAKYFLAIDAGMLTFTTPQAGTRELDVSMAACSFDKTGQPLQFLQKTSVAKLNDEQFAAASHGVTETFQFSPKPGVARVRLLVRDSVSGRIGSVDIPYTPAPTPRPTLLNESPDGKPY